MPVDNQQRFHNTTIPDKNNRVNAFSTRAGNFTLRRFLKIWAHFLLRKKPGFAGVPSRAGTAPRPFNSLRGWRKPWIQVWSFATQNSRSKSIGFATQSLVHEPAAPLRGESDPIVEFCNAKLQKQIRRICDRISAIAQYLRKGIPARGKRNPNALFR
jgi:hypothetical protein